MKLGQGLVTSAKLGDVMACNAEREDAPGRVRKLRRYPPPLLIFPVWHLLHRLLYFCCLYSRTVMTTPNRPAKGSSASKSQNASQGRQASLLGFFSKKSDQKPAVPKPNFKDAVASRTLKTPIPSSDGIEPASSPIVQSKSSFTSASSFGMGKENGVDFSSSCALDLRANLNRSRQRGRRRSDSKGKQTNSL
jgi:hypothetical protein